MKFDLHLEENETSADVNTLSVTNALLNFINEHNSHAIMKTIQEFCPFIFAKDIADIIYVLSNSTSEYLNNLKELQNER